jgi:hypothetical protein
MQKKRNIKLDELENKQVFSVPNGYFEQLPGQISQKIAQPQSTYAWFRLPVFRYGAALASIFLIVIVGYFIFRTPETQLEQPEAILSQVSRQDIIQYLQQADVSQYELVERASDANIILEENALEEIEINQEILLEETDNELIEELI